MTIADGIARQLQGNGYAVIPGLMSQQAVTAAKAELGALLDAARWGSGFDGARTKRAWAPLAVTRCMDQAALAPLVLDATEQLIGPGCSSEGPRPDRQVPPSHRSLEKVLGVVSARMWSERHPMISRCDD
jgi:hypothetical protein